MTFRIWLNCCVLEPKDWKADKHFASFATTVLKKKKKGQIISGSSIWNMNKNALLSQKKKIKIRGHSCNKYFCTGSGFFTAGFHCWVMTLDSFIKLLLRSLKILGRKIIQNDCIKFSFWANNHGNPVIMMFDFVSRSNNFFWVFYLLIFIYV